jgi:outer membrane protein assembly factor BamE (lipoprotein component of BamABCDE complex)
MQERATMVRSNIIIGFLSLVVACNSYASDRDRITQLEKEVQEIKVQLSKLESLPTNPANPQQSVISAEGWKSVSSWRKLTTDMSTSDVRKILGEPHRVDGGAISVWHYQNGGHVMFMDGKVLNWSEPGK